MKMFRICVYLLLCLFCEISYASEFNPDDCFNFYIQLTNDTTSICKLIDMQVHGGVLMIPVPGIILPHESSWFVMINRISNRASIQITYDCDGESITLSSINSTPVYGVVAKSSLKISARKQTLDHDCWYDQPGHIYWYIHSENFPEFLNS